ncbi:hypothetical protein E1B28_000638 [Marasmius oreades]|uniref:BAG domain-containing protein n=1 Tax=Marasmius oreades TaxID=181124 RepID=A0A9P7V1Q3_9AGAR|nr:uncharacterized protein E1B28_000638 [Marasmius oreades]KAG7098725.1 hypothetical protein E1B28_000638 [Marasmius oreades]
MPLTLTCGNDRRVLTNPPGYDEKLAALKQIVKDWTGCNEFKMIHKGAVMKDDNAPLSAYHIKHNSTIAIIPKVTVPTPATSSISKSEQNTVTRIVDELSSVRSTLVLDLQSFVNHPTEKEHMRLSELLLQSLLRLDAVSPEPTWEAARRDRKNAVKEVQGYIDQLDDAWRSRPR